jgi:hypothetical protein
VKKFFLPLSVILAVAVTVRIGAQSSPNPTPASSPAAAVNPPANAPLPAPSPSPTAAIEPPSLIPENILPPPNSLPQVPRTPDLEALNAFFKQTSLGKKADEQRLHLATAKLEVQIRNDPDLHRLWADALRQRTDLDRRHRLRIYYPAYYKKLRNLAATPELKAHISAEEAGRELSLLQPRVRHETDGAAAAALAKARAGASAAPRMPTPIQARASDALRP